MRWFVARLDEKHKLLGNFDENSIEKLNFIFIFRKFVTKNIPFGNSTIFLQQFFRLRGERDFPLSTPLLWGSGGGDGGLLCTTLLTLDIHSYLPVYGESTPIFDFAQNLIQIAMILPDYYSPLSIHSWDFCDKWNCKCKEIYISTTGIVRNKRFRKKFLH